LAQAFLQVLSIVWFHSASWLIPTCSCQIFAIILMMSLRGIVVFLFLAPGEALVPGGIFGTRTFSRAGPQAGALRKGSLQGGRHPGHFEPRSGEPLLAFGPSRAKVSLQATSNSDELKKLVGYRAVDDHVTSNMVVGLGTGSTAYFAVERLGEKLKDGSLTNITAVPTSVRTREQAEELGIPLATLDTHEDLDVAIDGADSVDRKTLGLVKGGGGALFREKLVEVRANKFVVIVDDSKLCDGLGPHFPVPVEIAQFCHGHILRKIEALPALKGCKAVLRMGSSSNNQPDGDEPAVTDNGNFVVDLHFTEPIADPAAAAAQLKATVGVVEHGFFIGMASEVIVAASDGIQVLKP